MRRMSEYTSPVGNIVLKKIVRVNIRTTVKTAIVNLFEGDVDGDGQFNLVKQNKNFLSQNTYSHKLK